MRQDADQDALVFDNGPDVEILEEVLGEYELFRLQSLDPERRPRTQYLYEYLLAGLGCPACGPHVWPENRDIGALWSAAEGTEDEPLGAVLDYVPPKDRDTRPEPKRIEIRSGLELSWVEQGSYGSEHGPLIAVWVREGYWQDDSTWVDGAAVAFETLSWHYVSSYLSSRVKGPMPYGATFHDIEGLDEDEREDRGAYVITEDDLYEPWAFGYPIVLISEGGETVGFTGHRACATEAWREVMAEIVSQAPDVADLDEYLWTTSLQESPEHIWREYITVYGKTPALVGDPKRPGALKVKWGPWRREMPALVVDWSTDEYRPATEDDVPWDEVPYDYCGSCNEPIE